MIHSPSAHTHRATDPAGSRLSNGRAGEAVNSPSPDADPFTFRAPRYGDLVVCPYCDADNPDPRFIRCDHCGDEGTIFASEVFQ